MRPLKTATPKRRLFSLNEIESVCAKALEVSKNGAEFGDYVRLMAFGGSRRDETLRLRWSDVDWEQKQLVIGSDGLAKNHKAREVDFNADLETHLKSMHTRRAPDSEFLFPSPQRGEKDQHAKTFKETLNAAREKAAVPDFNFHDCRHFFISTCVMAGVDFMTIAKWVGHQDGGVLIGKVYGHLADEHRKRQAQKVAFFSGKTAVAA
jgi:integrase